MLSEKRNIVPKPWRSDVCLILVNLGVKNFLSDDGLYKYKSR